LDGVVEFFGFVGVVSMGGTEDAATVEQVPGSSAINVFVTGQPGVGKTSLVLNAVKKLPQEAVAGFYTLEARNPKTGEKIGLDVETFAGERAPLSRLRRGCGPKVGKYYFALEAFEKTVLPLLTPSKVIKLHVVDEVGRMELQSDRFKESLMALLASPQVAVFGSLPACRYGHDLPFVEAIKRRPDTAILTLTKSNRDAAALQVEDLLKNIVGSSASAASILELQAGSTASSERKLSNCGSIPADNFFSSDPAEHTDVREEEPAEKRRKLSSELLL
jgi:nucleoside-triphosphatase